MAVVDMVRFPGSSADLHFDAAETIGFKVGRATSGTVREIGSHPGCGWEMAPVGWKSAPRHRSRQRRASRGNPRQ
jgi:hypothetical protein